MRTTYGHGPGPLKPTPNYNLNRWMKEPWIQCHICSFCIPRSEAVRHYRKNKLVCQQCDDAFSNDDLGGGGFVGGDTTSAGGGPGGGLGPPGSDESGAGGGGAGEGGAS